MNDEELAAAYLDAGERGDWDTHDRLGAELNRRGDEEVATATQHLQGPGSLLNAALWYAEQGIAVFPVVPGGKLPATRHGFKDATTDPDQVRAWWGQQNPNYNIGAPTGATFDVIDVDGAEGCRSFYGRGVNVSTFIMGRSRTTRPGGWHVFVLPGALDSKNRAGILLGVDYRGAGGFCILPPSVGANGKRYRWVDPLLLNGELRS